MILRLITYSLTSALGLMLIKRSMSKLQVLDLQQIMGIIRTWDFAVGFTLYLAAFLYWLYLLSNYELSRAFPIAGGLVMLFIVVFSVLFLNERLILVNILGIILMQVSIVMINYGRAS